MIKKLFIASPHGFCAGVERAVSTLEKVLKKYKSPIYVNHQIVHNEYLVNYFKNKGVIFGADLNEIPKDSVMVFSAHGVPPNFIDKCKNKNLKIIDATCPLVLRIHTQVKNYAEKGYEIIMIGKKRHQEVKGTSGVADIVIVENILDVRSLDTSRFTNGKTVCLTQTTLSMDDTKKIIDALKRRIPHMEILSGICYASQNRQNAVKKLAEKCDFIIILGSENSSNSNRLVDTAKDYGCEAILLNNPDDIQDEVFKYEKVGISSGASVPEILFEKLIEKLEPAIIERIEITEENLSFQLPQELL